MSTSLSYSRVNNKSCRKKTIHPVPSVGDTPTPHKREWEGVPGLPETESLGLLFYGKVEPVPELGLGGVGRPQEVVEARVGGGEAVRVAPVLAGHPGLLHMKNIPWFCS